MALQKDPTGRISHTQEFHRDASWKTYCRAATTANGTLATAYANGQTVDGVTLATGDRILLKDQTAGAENGIYTVNASGAPTRAFDMDQDATTDVVGDEIRGAVVHIIDGTTNGGTIWRCTNTAAVTLGTTAITFVQLGDMTNPMTTEGDIIYSSDGSGTPARLAIGTANQLLHGGTDPSYSAVLPADLDVSADNTTADATTGHHGLLPKLGGGTTNYLRADGTWSAPGGGSSPLSTKGDLHGYDTGDARIPIGTDGDVLTADSTQTLGLKWASGGGGGISSGTAFPGSPSTDDLYQRTDLGLLFFYDGTRWLTLNLYREPVGWATVGVAVVVGRIPSWQTSYDIWLDAFWTTYNVQTTNNGSNYWTLSLRKLDSTVSATTVASHTTASDSTSTAYQKETSIGALLGSYVWLDFLASPTGSPTAMNVGASVTYRLVGT